MSERLSLLIADDHEVVRLALRHALQALADDLVVFEAEDAPTTEARLAQCRDGNHPASVALVDWKMPGVAGVGWFRGLIVANPATRIVVMSGAEDAAVVRELLVAGAAGFIPKTDSAAVILQAMRLVLAGGTYAPVRLLSPDSDAAATVRRASGIGVESLTERQLDVLRLLAKGLPNKLIARELKLSEGTVKVHVLAIFRTLSVKNRTEAVVAAAKFLGAAE